MKTIHAIHLLNDFSGSPLVFSESLKVLSAYEVNIKLYTSKKTTGFLSNISGVEYHFINYKWFDEKWKTLFFFFYFQVSLFFKILKNVSKNDIVYINTLLPFGAALAAYLKNAEIVYHVHEVSIQPAILKNFLLSIVKITKAKCIFVSKFVAEQSNLFQNTSTIIYNALPEEFSIKADIIKRDTKKPFTVLMLCSNKVYKGIHEFIEIASKIPDISFQLILNTSENEKNKFMNEHKISNNCEVLSAQKDTIPFYNKASVVLNLSHPERWIETFGMTLLEAMCFGIPVIGPTVGGPVEIIQHNYNGFSICVHQQEKIIETLNRLKEDKNHYQLIAENALKTAQKFNHNNFSMEINTIFNLNSFQNMENIFQNMENISIV